MVLCAHRLCSASYMAKDSLGGTTVSALPWIRQVGGKPALACVSGEAVDTSRGDTPGLRSSLSREARQPEQGARGLGV